MANAISSESKFVAFAAFDAARHAEPPSSHREALKIAADASNTSTSTVGRYLRERKGQPRLAKQATATRNGRVLSSEDLDALCEWVRATPSLSTYQLRLRLKTERDVTACNSTIQRGLHGRGISKRRLAAEARAQRVAAEGQRRPATRLTDEHRRKAIAKPNRPGYPSDITDAEWAILKPLLETTTGPRKYPLREIVDALSYQTRTGCQWRYLPRDFPPFQVVNRYYMDWSRSGLLDRIHDTLREKTRVALGRTPTPSAGCIDSQTVKSSGAVEEVGYDGGKKMNGRKRHIVTDTLGLILAICVHSAGIQDRDGGREVANAELAARYAGLQVIFADAGYQGGFERWVNNELPFRLDVVHRNGDSTRGDWVKDGETPVRSSKFKVVRKRWVVERTFGWLSRWRRLSRDYEVTPASARARVLWAAAYRMLALLPRVDR